MNARSVTPPLNMPCFCYTHSCVSEICFEIAYAGGSGRAVDFNE